MCPTVELVVPASKQSLETDACCAVPVDAVVVLAHSIVLDARRLSWYTISAAICFVVLSVHHVFMPLPVVLENHLIIIIIVAIGVQRVYGMQVHCTCLIIKGIIQYV